MANFIDIKDFEGALTNADLEDLPDNVAQEIKNLKIEAGRLKKTFGAGTPSGTPTIGLSFVNTTTGKTYTVYNVCTFISDKFSGNSNNAGDGYRYILVTINEDKKVKLWWYDPSLPDVTDHLQIENNIMWFKTGVVAHGIVEDDYVLVQECKDNASPQASISGAGVYQQADHITSTTSVGINTDSASTWGGRSFFETTLTYGAIDKSWGGKHSTHVIVDEAVDFGGTYFSILEQIAVAPMASNGRVLSLANTGTSVVTLSTGSDYIDLNQPAYNSYSGGSFSGFGVCGMKGFNNAVYVHYSYNGGSPTVHYNQIVKYTCTTGGSIQETVVGALPSSTTTTQNSHLIIANNKLYILAETLGLYTVDTSDNIVQMTLGISGGGTIPIADTKGLTSIAQTNRLSATGSTSLSDVVHEYLVVQTQESGDIKYYTLDILSSETNFALQSSATISGTPHHLTKTDFGQNSNRSESIVSHYSRGSNYYIKYSTHADSTVISALSTDVNASKFPTSIDCTLLDHAVTPDGSHYLIVGTDDVTSPTQTSGKLWRVNSSISAEIICNPGTGDVDNDKDHWNPTCFADCHTGSGFFTHAKGYIALYGTEAQAGAPAGNSADVYRMTDIGWYANTWNGSGDCDYRWIDIMDKYNIGEVDTSNQLTTPVIYHNNDRNPVIPSGDTIRFVPGAVGKISDIEAKGVWLGYINRSLFNNLVSANANWFLYANKLNNPFSITNTIQYNTGTSIRPGNSVKYNITAVYDGVQETLFDKSKEKVLSETGINNSVIELEIEFDASALNKRITGINVYRATEFTNTTSFDGYSNYQLIGHMTFVDSQTAIPTTTSNTIGRLHVWREDCVFIKSPDNLNGYDGEKYGVNKYALGVDGGWDGIDEMTEWAGPPASGVSDEFQWTVYHSPLARKMNATQEYMIVSALAKDNTLANTYKCEIEDESVVINDVASSYDYTGFTATVASGSGTLQFTMSSAVEGYFAVDDKILTVASPAMGVGTYWNVISVGTGSSQIVTASRQDSGVTTGASGVKIYMQEPASGVLVGVDRHGLGSPTATVNWLDNSTASTPETHDLNTGIHIRSQSLPRSYSKANLDSNASMGDSYLDSGVMIGSDWEIERRKNGQYSTSLESTSGGAYGGQRIGFLHFPFPDDITGTLGTDTTGDLLTEGYFSGSLLLLQGDESFEIESNSAYEKTLGGCWVKLNEKHNEFGVDNDTIDESDAGHVKDNVRIISGFKQTNAQGGTTPGMAFQTITGSTVKVVCQDFRLEDLGETSIQTVYSNRVNGQFSVKLKGRMFLGNLILNPEDKQEEHEDWIAYSELNQYDNRPVSNVITLDDREGGAVSGLAVLFGRLIVFKPQAIFILNVTDPADPNTWNVTESKHSIGNIAPEGVVEVHDSVYFVFHDGIYAVTSNMVADSTATPSVMEKITLPIEDQFNSANSKKDIKGIYNQKDSEILYTWQTGSPASQIVWAYHVVLKTWRKVETSTNLDILAYGENSYPIAWDNTDTDVKKFDVDEAVGTAWKSKKFRLDLDNKRLIRYGMIQFTGTDTLTVNLYLDGSGSASFTKTITADGGVNRFPIKRYGKNFEIELTTPTSTNAFSVERMRIETE